MASANPNPVFAGDRVARQYSSGSARRASLRLVLCASAVDRLHAVTQRALVVNEQSIMDAACVALGDGGFSDAWAEGESMTIAQASAEILRARSTRLAISRSVGTTPAVASSRRRICSARLDERIAVAASENMLERNLLRCAHHPCARGFSR
jgi:hypothetical protein